ncbi:subtilase family serine peptidase [Skeletonema marinoi]|uniref:subtilisin n=1 Tax=Skeletonema marinoi TaxID=267567 RepID=A0AAD8YCE0_9STRA|nr:subtilase family serine peptidase [Skeletonema marinoi]
MTLLSVVMSIVMASETLLAEKMISREHFSSLLRTAFEDEVTFSHLSKKNNRQLSQEESEHAWLDILNYGMRWTQSKHHRALRPDNYTGSEPKHPYVLCSRATNKSGLERLQLLAQSLGISVERSQTVSNTDEESCFIVSVTSSTIQTAHETDISNSSFTPLVDVMKISSGGIRYILEDAQWQPTAASASAGGDGLLRTTHVASLMVDLIPGEGVNAVNSSTAATQILNDVIAMIQSSINNINIISSSNLRSTSNQQLSNIVPMRDAFSLTSSLHNNKQLRSFTDSVNVWSEALFSGFEANHHCKNMFDLLQVRERGEIEGFELLLNAQQTVEDEGTAWNKNCVISLIIGLSVNQSVQSVDVGRPLEISSFDEETSSTTRELAVQGITNPQWISQSGVVNERPFFDNDLDGSGQTVGIADAGLDTDNCYFYDSSNSEDFYGRYSWDMSQRKVVHYDSDFADRRETNRGHGTAVAAAAVGRRSFDGLVESNGYADGTAPGSKLAFLDMGVGSAAIQDPGVVRLFESLSQADHGAKIIVGSWGRSYYGVYSSFCKDYDAILRDTFTDVLFVASSGNTGSTGTITVQNPADCKNVLSVGSGLNYGNDIRSNELGIEYLADYSSKGPTADGRIKPDIIAPGHFLLTANANVDMVGECDGGIPDSRYGARGDGVRYVSGTSFAAPTVAGSAALIRQYFIEGWCTTDRCCGSKGCGSIISPSNSLMKALLLNGAVPMTGKVQKVPNGAVLEESFAVYDGKQGFGRINLLNSVPLYGSNELQLIAVNDKTITYGNEHDYIIDIDTSNGCSSDLKVTLVWMDPPGATGCLNCLVNDLDVLVEEIGGSSKTYYPNGLSRRDNKNTVERIVINTSNGERFRVSVKATNLVSEQRYSLAIAGCLADDIDTSRNQQTNSPSKRPTDAPTSKRPTNQQTTQLTSCMSPDECNKARKQKGITRMFVGENFPSYGCFIKGNTAFFGLGFTSKEQIENTDLPGYRQRLMCQLEASGTNTTIDYFSVEPSSAPSLQPSMNPTIHPTLNQTSGQTMQPTQKLTPWPTNDASVLPTPSTTVETATNEARWWPKIDKRKIECILSTDYKVDVAGANVMFETEDDCVEYLVESLKKHG